MQKQINKNDQHHVKLTMHSPTGEVLKIHENFLLNFFCFCFFLMYEGKMLKDRTTIKS